MSVYTRTYNSTYTHTTRNNTQFTRTQNCRHTHKTYTQHTHTLTCIGSFGRFVNNTRNISRKSCDTFLEPAYDSSCLELCSSIRFHSNFTQKSLQNLFTPLSPLSPLLSLSLIHAHSLSLSLQYTLSLCLSPVLSLSLQYSLSLSLSLQYALSACRFCLSPFAFRESKYSLYNPLFSSPLKIYF